MLVPAAAQIIRVWSVCYGLGPISQADQNGGYCLLAARRDWSRLVKDYDRRRSPVAGPHVGLPARRSGRRAD